MTVQEDLSPKVVVAGPLAVGDLIPLDFNYVNEEDIGLNNNGTALIYNIDYEVDGQSVRIKVAIDGDGPITAFRRTPFNQEAEFPQNNRFNSAKLNESLDKICMQQQEQEERIGRGLALPIGMTGTFNAELPIPIPGKGLRINDDGTGFTYTKYDPDNITEAVMDAEEYAQEAKKWANYTEGPVEDSEYSSKYYAEQAEEQAELAAMYADKAEFGMKWTEFKIANWVAREEDDNYELTLSDLPLVTAVYKGTWESKEYVCGVNIYSTSSGSKLISLNAFDGYALSAASSIGSYLHVQDIESDEWVIQHNLGHIPCITLLNTGNVEIVGTIEHDNFNACTVTFETPVAGKAYLR